MTQPDGRPSTDVAKTTAFTSRGLKVTLLDVAGTYVAEVAREVLHELLVEPTVATS